MPPAPPVERFEGFDDPKFFRELAKHQSREWFAAQKRAYEEGFVSPMTALLSELGRELDSFYPDCDLGQPKVFRIQRDVRFSSDKSPYKTHVAGVLPIKVGGTSRGTDTPAAMYLQVGFDPGSRKDSHRAGAGLYMMNGAQLAKYRKFALDEDIGSELARVVRALEKHGASIEAGETLKRVPRGVDPTHPRAGLLKQKGLVAMFGELPSGLVQKRELADWLLERGKRSAPLVRWLAWRTR